MKKSLAFLICFVSIIFAFAAETKKPNIVIILCDDLGYGEISAFNPERNNIPTPNVDQLAKEGMSFTDAHSGSSVCTPTRYGLLTGRYAWRSRLQRGIISENQEPLIPTDRITLPSLLKQAGYYSTCIGKWHLGFGFKDAEGNTIKVKKTKNKKSWSANVPIGSIVPDGPTTRGFDEFYGFFRSSTMGTIVNNGKVVREADNDEVLPLLRDKACEFIDKHHKDEKPWLLYLPLNSPHGPIAPSKPWQGKSKLGPYGDFILETDGVVGDVIKKLDEYKLRENTLVIFTSDNGCSKSVAKATKLEEDFGHYPSAHFRGYKSDIWEGGHRIPFIASWPGKIKADTTQKQIICLTDIFATVAELNKISFDEKTGEDSF